MHIWTYKQLKEFQDHFGISNAKLAKVLDIDRSTLTLWGKRNDSWEVPSNYWPILNQLEEACLKSENDNPHNISSKLMGPLVISLLAAAVGGPLLGAASAGVSLAANSFILPKGQTDIDCPFCSEKIKSDAIKCKHCHSVLHARILEYVCREDGVNYIEFQDRHKKIYNNKIHGITSSPIELLFTIRIYGKSYINLEYLVTGINTLNYNICAEGLDSTPFAIRKLIGLKFDANDSLIDIKLIGSIGIKARYIDEMAKQFINNLRRFVSDFSIEEF